MPANDYTGECEDQDFAFEHVEQMDLRQFAKRYSDDKAYAHDLFYGDYWSDFISDKAALGVFGLNRLKVLAYTGSI